MQSLLALRDLVSASNVKLTMHDYLAVQQNTSQNLIFLCKFMLTCILMLIDLLFAHLVSCLHMIIGVMVVLVASNKMRSILVNGTVLMRHYKNGENVAGAEMHLEDGKVVKA